MSLSDKIWREYDKSLDMKVPCLDMVDVKEAVKELKDSLRDQHHSDEPDDNLYIAVNKIKGRIRKIFGKELCK